MNVGEKIKQRRLELEMSQDELAKKCGYKSRSSIQKIECSRELPLKKARIMADILDLPFSYLMGWEENKKEISEDDYFNLHKSHSFIDTLLNSEFYRGKYRENENFCEPYITKEQDKIIKSRKNSYIRTHYDSRRIYLFTGLLKCPLCNRTLEPKGELLKSGSTYHYYRCTEPYRTKNCTFKYNINERYIEDFLLTYLDDYLKNYKAQVEILSNTKNKKSDIKKYIDEKQRLTTAFIKGRLPEDVYDSEFERLEKLISQESIDESKEIDIDRLNKILSDDWKIVYLQLKRENQKLFWKSIIKSIQFNDDKTVKSVIFL